MELYLYSIIRLYGVVLKCLWATLPLLVIFHHNMFLFLNCKCSIFIADSVPST